MTVKFLILDTKYYDGTISGYNKAVEKALEITVKNAVDVDAIIEHYHKKYPATKYDFDDIKWK